MCHASATSRDDVRLIWNRFENFSSMSGQSPTSVKVCHQTNTTSEHLGIVMKHKKTPQALVEIRFVFHAFHTRANKRTQHSYIHKDKTQKQDKNLKLTHQFWHSC